MISLIVAGPRDFWDYSVVKPHLDQFKDLNPDIVEVVEGEAKGIDTLSKIWARINKIPLAPYPADWDRFGKAAGMIRNTEMAWRGTHLLAFDKGTKGTGNMIKEAKKAGVIVKVIPIK